MTLYSRISNKIKQIQSQSIDRLYSRYAKFRLKNSEFCIVCNNCFGGHLYESTNRPYNTPTVGLYFFAEDYIKFIENIDVYLNEEVKFIEKSRFEESHKEHQSHWYPIGLLSNNLEIHFLHYKNQHEAKTKWDRRKARFNKEKMLIVMNDQNRFKSELMTRFDQINFPKVFLSSKQRDGENVKIISYYNDKQFVGDMYNDKLKCLKDFDLVAWIRKQSL